MKRTIALTTPTGNVGSKLVAYLREQTKTSDIELVVIGRKPELLSTLAGDGVRVVGGHLDDTHSLVDATRGVDALFWATPNSFPPGITLREGYRRFAHAAAMAIKANKIAHTVHLSGFAHVDDGGGEHSLLGGLADTETILGQAVEELSLNHPQETYGVTHLRAGFFFENFLGQITFIRKEGRVYLPVNRNQRIPMVASQDVARRAFDILNQKTPRGRFFAAALGPHDLSFKEAASHLTTGLGKRVRIIRLPRFIIRSQMLKVGRDPRPTDALMLIFRAINEGRLKAKPPRDEQSTTSTSLTAWTASVLKPLVDGDGGDLCPARVQFEAS